MFVALGCASQGERREERPLAATPETDHALIAVREKTETKEVKTLPDSEEPQNVGSAHRGNLGTPHGTYDGRNRVILSNVLIYAPTSEQALELLRRIEAQFTPDPRRQMLFDTMEGQDIYWTAVHTTQQTQDGWNISLTFWALGGANHPGFARLSRTAHLALVEDEHASALRMHLESLDQSHIHSLNQADLKGSLKALLRDIKTNGKGW